MRIITAIPPRWRAPPDEERYLCGAVSEYLRAPVDPADIVWRYAGVRPLLDDGASKAQEATRDYVLALEAPALLSVFGGKITTYRRLAEAAMAKLARLFPGMRGAWTAGAALPGGDFPWDGIEQVRADLARRYPFLSDGNSAPPGPRLRHAGGGDARRCTRRCRPGALFRRRSHRARGRLADPHRMGAHRGGRALATQQARTALQCSPRVGRVGRSPLASPRYPAATRGAGQCERPTAVRRRTGCGWRHLPGRRTGRSAATTGTPPGRRRRGSGSRRADRG